MDAAKEGILCAKKSGTAKEFNFVSLILEAKFFCVPLCG